MSGPIDLSDPRFYPSEFAVIAPLIPEDSAGPKYLEDFKVVDPLPKDLTVVRREPTSSHAEQYIHSELEKNIKYISDVLDIVVGSLDRIEKKLFPKYTDDDYLPKIVSIPAVYPPPSEIATEEAIALSIKHMEEAIQQYLQELTKVNVEMVECGAKSYEAIIGMLGEISEKTDLGNKIIEEKVIHDKSFDGIISKISEAFLNNLLLANERITQSIENNQPANQSP